MNLRMLPVRLLKPPRMESAQAATELTGSQECQAWMRELSGDAGFNMAIESKMRAVLRHGYVSDGWAEFLYCVVRQTKPKIVVETGVFQGCSSAHMLRAMELNGSGQLISIDLPTVSDGVAKASTDRMGDEDALLPPGLGPGWVIPDSLRERHELLLGDAKLLLADVLKRSGPIDIFIHDSLHTDEHMSWEYRTAWPHIRSGGILASDDIFWNPAFHRFSRSVKRPYVNGMGKFGAMRKEPN